MRPTCAALLFAILACSWSAAAETNAATPGTSLPVAGIAQELLNALNKHDTTRTFVEHAFTQKALEKEPAERRIALLDALAQQSNGFDLVSATKPSERMTELTVKSRSNPTRFGRIIIFESGKEPGKATDIFVLEARNPAMIKLDAFPDKRVNDTQIALLVRSRLDHLTKEGLFSGSVLVAHRGKVIVQEARGDAEAASGMPNRIDTRFNIASMGKMWTAVVVLKLVEEGVLSLDDTVARWVPEYPHPEAAEGMTLRDLLRHSAGVEMFDVTAVHEPLSAVQMAGMMKAKPGPPGSVAYSNGGYILLAAAAERASGKTLEALVHELVFVPSEMSQSGFWPVTAIVSNRARGYLRPADDPLGFKPRHANEQFLGYGATGAGGEYSTVDDMYRFHTALGKGRLLSAQLLKAIVDNAVEFPGGPRPARYGLGFRLETCGSSPMLGHNGGGAGSGVSNASYVSLDGEWTIIVLGNVDPEPEVLAHEICELVNR